LFYNPTALPRLYIYARVYAYTYARDYKIMKSDQKARRIYELEL